jgi:hypothetical protein
MEMLTHDKNRTNHGVKLTLVLAICAILVSFAVGTVSAAEVQAQESHYITELTATLSGCPTGANWERFAYDGESGITYCMNRVPGLPPTKVVSGSPDKLTYTIAQIKAYHATGSSCGEQFGTGWEQWGWDAQAHIHFCAQLGNGFEPTYLTTIKSVLAENCDSLGAGWELAVYNGDSNISFCVQSAVNYGCS